MENMIEVLRKARNKKIFLNNEFEELLMEIQLADSNLKLDWDDGAGEEWARFFSQKDGIVCMVSAKIGVAFIKKCYEFNNIKNTSINIILQKKKFCEKIYISFKKYIPINGIIYLNN